MSLHTWCCQGPRKPSSCATFMLNTHWGRAVTAKKNLASTHAGWFWSCQKLCNPVDCGLPGFSVGEVSRQEHWSVLANTSCHTLLEHYISCFPSHQLLWVPGAARTPATQASTPPPLLALTGVDPSPPGQPQGQTPVDDPHAEVETKPQLKPKGSVTKEENPKTSHQLYKLQIKSTHGPHGDAVVRSWF